MRIFIDTNTFFGYFSEDADISPLEELLKLVKEKKIIVFHTEQLENEFLRGVGNRIEQERKAVKTRATVIKRDTLEKLNSSVKEKVEGKIALMNIIVDTDSKKRIKRYEIKVRKLEKYIMSIFKKCERYNYTPQIIERAKFRHFIGNPPKKPNSDSHGDAINWETILEYAYDDDLNIISRDTDFVEKVKGESKINRLLQKEWGAKSKSELKLSLSIGSLINETEKKKVVSDDTVTTEETFPAYTDDVFDIVWRQAGELSKMPTIGIGNSTRNGFASINGSHVELLTPLNIIKEVQFCPYCGDTNPIKLSDNPSGIGNVYYGSLLTKNCTNCGANLSHLI